MVLAWFRPLFAHLRPNKHPTRVHVLLLNSSVHVLNGKNFPWVACYIHVLQPMAHSRKGVPWNPPRFSLHIASRVLDNSSIQWPHKKRGVLVIIKKKRAKGKRKTGMPSFIAVHPWFVHQSAIQCACTKTINTAMMMGYLDNIAFEVLLELKVHQIKVLSRTDTQIEKTAC
jgi:hypothetical protein